MKKLKIRGEIFIIQNEKQNEKIDIEKLGDEKLDLKIEYPKIETKRDMRMIDGTIKDFLGGICGELYSSLYHEQIHFVEMEALNKNKEKIKKIVDYVINLDQKENYDPICSSARRYIWTPKQVDIIKSLDFEKTYMILQLIQWGVNPFEIRKCLKLNGNNNFNYKKFMEFVMDNKDILFTMSRDSYFSGQRFERALNMIRVMYLLNPLFKSNENQSDNLKPFKIDFLLQDLSFLFEDSGMHFIIWYLNQLDNNDGNKKVKEYLLKVPDGYVLKNFVSKSRISEKEDIDKLQRGNLLDLSSLISENNNYFFDFNKKDFEKDKDFWTLITNLNNDPVMISFFTLVAMCKVSFTERQMNFIATKIKNQMIMGKLREINQNPNYKTGGYIHGYNLKRRVRFGPVTAFLDYIFLKMSRGIGYLGAALFNAILCMLPIGIGGGAMFGIVCWLFLASALYTTMFWVVAPVLSGAVALLFLWCFIEIYGDSLKSRFIKFADGMEKFYNEGKIVYWLESYNIKHSMNNIGESPIKISTDLSKGSGLPNLSNGRYIRDACYPDNSKLIDEPEE